MEIPTTKKEKMKRKKGMKKTGKNVNKTNPILINKELTILSIKF